MPDAKHRSNQENWLDKIKLKSFQNYLSRLRALQTFKLNI